MYLKINATSATLWISADDTDRWTRSWPCSELRSRRVRATFDRSGLIDIAIDNGRGSQDCSANEFSAICADFLRDRLPSDHPAYPVAVDQFKP